MVVSKTQLCRNGYVYVLSLARRGVSSPSLAQDGLTVAVLLEPRDEGLKNTDVVL